VTKKKKLLKRNARELPPEREKASFERGFRRRKSTVSRSTGGGHVSPVTLSSQSKTFEGTLGGDHFREGRGADHYEKKIVEEKKVIGKRKNVKHVRKKREATRLMSKKAPLWAVQNGKGILPLSNRGEKMPANEKVPSRGPTTIEKLARRRDDLQKG